MDLLSLNQFERNTELESALVKMQSLEEENESLKRQMNRRSSSATNLQGSSPSMIAFHGRQGTGLSQEFTLEDELQNAATPPDDDESEVCFFCAFWNA